jgi:uncharacterized protein (DUF302 family)
MTEIKDHSDFAPRSSTSTGAIARTTVTTSLGYHALVTAFEAELGRWDAAAGAQLIARKASWSDIEREVSRMAGPRGLMIIVGVDQGSVTSLSGEQKRCALYLVGNPVIASGILSVDPRGSLYVPFRVALYEHPGAGGASIAYDRPSSSLALLERPELTEVGLLLDEKIDSVARCLAAASPRA